jgi:polysaccharide biosynthesis transport protein
MADFTTTPGSAPAGGAHPMTAGGSSSGNGRPVESPEFPGNHAFPANPAQTPHFSHSHGHGHSTETAEGLVQILARQWQVIALCAVVTVLLAMVYLLLAKPVYTSSAKLQVQPLGSQIIDTTKGEDTGGQGEISNDFLATECDVITSNPVLALALKNMDETRTLHGQEYPLYSLKYILSADVSKKGQTIDVTLSTPYRDEADRILGAVLDAYGSFESENWKNKVDQSMNAFQKGRDDTRERLKKETDEMLAMAREKGISIDADPEKSPARVQVESLSEALTKARLEVISAKDAYDQAAKSIIGDAKKLAEVNELEKHASSSADPAVQVTTLQTALFTEQARLADASQKYMPNHPIVLSYQNRIDKLTVQIVAAAEQWWESAQLREASLQQSLEDAKRAEVDETKNAMEYATLQDEIKKLKMDDANDSRIQELTIIRGAGATNITVLDPPEIDGSPSPHKGRTMAVALVLGLILGLGIACIRDWLDDRLRSLEAIRATVGAPVLGAVPAISTAYTAADRGQIVQNDPFGEASEAYRTLRTALQYGLPHNARTVLVTSPIAGEGKSTMVSNLAIAMAQANKRVLVIDADLRAPTQHRLFGLKDRRGLATVLGGGDTLDQAIQETEIQGLDLLPCGPIPTNPAEMLNDPAFTDYLNDLADRYDLVLIDSPPVTAVTDARIIAASVDATLLVIRPEASNRKQAEHARDGLRSVGARVIGVAVNGVTRAANFGGATGYYSRSDAAVAAGARLVGQRRTVSVKSVGADLTRGQV